jgi:deazaflavin-dependent oxidoreductase (nitroreductase family)
MSQPTTIPPLVNNTMKVVLRSPVHGMVSKTVLLITFTGRKSGKTYTTPVSYSQFGNEVHIFTHAVWWRNLCNGAPVTLRIRGHEFQGTAETVAEDKKAIAAELMAHLRQVPFDAQFYDVTFDEHKNPNPEQVEKAAQSVVMVCVQLC